MFWNSIKLSMSLGLATLLWWLGPAFIHTPAAVPVWACGLGQPQTMDADGQPAVTFPLTPSAPPASPTGIFEEYYSVGQVVKFTEDLSRLPTPIDMSSFQWTWDFGDGHTAAGFSANHVYAKAGVFTVRLHLVDPKDATISDPNFDSSAITITSQHFDQPPIVQITSSDTYVQLGGALTYDATGSRSQVGGDLTYTWNFNDTTPEEHGMRVAHTFTTQGQAFVELIAQDARGARTVSSVPVVVAPELPSAHVTASSLSAQVGQSLAFDASQSLPTNQAGDAIVKYHWFFGDGTDETTTAAKIIHSFAKTGVYIVKVQAFDKTNLPGTASVTVRISDPGLLGLGSHANLILGSGIVIALLLLMGIIGNIVRERREEQRRLALAAARRARRPSHRR